MAPQAQIRQATLPDLDAVEAIEQGCFGADGDAFSRRQLRHLIARAQGVCFIALCGGRVAGYISLLTRRGAANVRIYSVAVDPLSRGCGAGQALVDAAVGYAAKRGLHEVTLEVRADNIPAMRLYRKNGFETDRVVKGYYHDGADGVRMKKKLP